MELNKVVASVLVAGITFFVCGVIGEALVSPKPLHESAIKVDIAAAAPSAAAKPEALAPIGPMLASANPAAGEALTKKLCTACHTFNEGGKNGVGPNLYGVVGRERGSEAGFSYSNAIKDKKGPWTYEDLNAWLHKPASFAAGTRMAFAGINSEKQRADIIAYLRTLSKNPEPLP
jgi:cytochrome c